MMLFTVQFMHFIKTGTWSNIDFTANNRLDTMLFCSTVKIDNTIHDAMVSDGNGRMSHAVGQLDDAAGITEAVHAGKLGVQMQLHTLDRCGILPLFTLHDEHIVGVDDIIVFVLVVGAVAAHDEGPHLPARGSSG